MELPDNTVSLNMHSQNDHVLLESVHKVIIIHECIFHAIQMSLISTGNWRFQPKTTHVILCLLHNIIYLVNLYASQNIIYI